MRLLPRRRRTRIVLAVAAGALLGVWLWNYRPWQAHYLGRPTSYWAERMADLPRHGPGPVPRTSTEEWFGRILASFGVTWDPWPSARTLYGKTEAAPVLIELLRDPNSRVRRLAAACLVELEPAPKEAVPALLEAWHKCRVDYRSQLNAGSSEFNETMDTAICIHDAIWFVDPEAAKRAGVLLDSLEPVEALYGDEPQK